MLESPATASASTSCKAPSTIVTVSVTSGSSAGRAAASCLHAAGHSASSGGVKAFQKSVRLSQTGRVDHATWAALLARGPQTRLHEGKTGAAVTRLQGALKALGYSTPVNGRFGATTKRAVQAVQTKEHWSRTGIAGGGTWSFLQHGGHWYKPKKYLQRSRVVVQQQGRAGVGLCQAAARRSLPLRGGRSQLLRLLRPGHGGLEVGRRLDPAPDRSHIPIGRTQGGQVPLQKGDLVFFYSGRSHVAIYAGNGMVIHAPHTGSHVSYIKMKYMPFNGAVRPS